MTTLTFLVLVLIGGSGKSAMTTIPQPYPYEECKARGEDFASINRAERRYFCIIAPDRDRK